MLNCFFIEMMEQNLIKDPIKFLDRLATLIPLKKMQEVTKENVNDALKEAKAMFGGAKFYLQLNQERRSPTIRAQISSILDGMIAIIESVVTAFGIGEFLILRESDAHADFKSQKIIMLLSIFSMISAVILPIVGAATGGVIIGGIFLAVIALSAIWPFIKSNHNPSSLSSRELDTTGAQWKFFGSRQKRISR